MTTQPITLCCQLWAHPGHEKDLTEYEDTVLALLPEYGAHVVSRAVSSGADGRPHEVQLLSCPDQTSLDAYLTDPRRAALSEVRDRAIVRTDLFEVTLRS